MYTVHTGTGTCVREYIQVQLSSSRCAQCVLWCACVWCACGVLRAAPRVPVQVQVCLCEWRKTPAAVPRPPLTCGRSIDPDHPGAAHRSCRLMAAYALSDGTSAGAGPTCVEAKQARQLRPHSTYLAEGARFATAGTDQGFVIVRIQPFKRRVFDGFGGGVGLCRMLGTSGLVAITGGGSSPAFSPRRVQIMKVNLTTLAHKLIVERDFVSTVTDILVSGRQQ